MLYSQTSQWPSALKLLHARDTAELAYIKLRKSTLLKQICAGLIDFLQSTLHQDAIKNKLYTDLDGQTTKKTD